MINDVAPSALQNRHTGERLEMRPRSGALSGICATVIVATARFFFLSQSDCSALVSTTTIAINPRSATSSVGQPQDIQAQQIFKSGVDYVEVDVVVTNPQGQVVRDLARDNFEVLEDGKRQALTTFARVDIPISATTHYQCDCARGAGRRDQRACGGGVYVLILDELHIAPAETERAKAAARQFVARLGANDFDGHRAHRRRGRGEPGVHRQSGATRGGDRQDARTRTTFVDREPE